MSGTSTITLAGKVIVVTGGSRGIGLAIAGACADAGAKVVIASRKQADLDGAAASLAGRGDVAAVACPSGKAGDVEALFAKAVETCGRVDGLVNNAATNPHFGPLVDTSDLAIDKTIEVNVKGYFYGSRALVRHARTRDGAAAIVNIASIMGMRAAPMQGIYGMTKAAGISMTQTMAFELGGSNIRVASGAAAQQDDAIGADLGRLRRLALLVGPLPRLDPSLDVDLLALREVLVERLGGLAPDDNAMPLRVLFHLPVAVLPLLGGRQTHGRDRRAASGEAHLGVAAKVADQDRLVHTAHRGSPPRLSARERTGL
jgi:NAD(P)-dependent dehydrogenase (short-subunit alcohol dehydrogenase family)